MATVITFGSEYTYNTNPLYVKAVCGLTDTKCIEVTNADGFQMSARIGTINGTVITWGSAQQVNTEQADDNLLIKKVSSTRVVVIYRTGYRFNMFTIDESSGTLTGNAVIEVANYDGVSYGGDVYGFDVAVLSTTKCIAVYSFGTYNDLGEISSVDNPYRNYTINSNGTFTQLFSQSGSYNSTSLQASYQVSVNRLTDNSAVVAYSYGPSGYQNQVTKIMTFSTSWSVGAANTLSVFLLGNKLSIIDSSKFYLFACNSTNVIYGYLCTISGTTVTYSAASTISGTTYVNSGTLRTCTMNGTRDVLVFTDGSNGLINGKATTITNNGSTVVFDTVYTFNTVGTQYVSTSALSNNAFIVIYSDGGNSNRPTGIVGTLPALGKKINGITYIKWNNTAITKWNNQ